MSDYMQNWSEILFAWVKSYYFMPTKPDRLEASDLNGFAKFAITQSIDDFVKANYPEFEPIVNENGDIVISEYVFIHTILMHFLHVRSPSKYFSLCTSSMSKDKKTYIIQFIKLCPKDFKAQRSSIIKLIEKCVENVRNKQRNNDINVSEMDETSSNSEAADNSIFSDQDNEKKAAAYRYIRLQSLMDNYSDSECSGSVFNPSDIDDRQLKRTVSSTTLLDDISNRFPDSPRSSIDNVSNRIPFEPKMLSAICDENTEDSCVKSKIDTPILDESEPMGQDTKVNKHNSELATTGQGNREHEFERSSSILPGIGDIGFNNLNSSKSSYRNDDTLVANDNGNDNQQDSIDLKNSRPHDQRKLAIVISSKKKNKQDDELEQTIAADAVDATKIQLEEQLCFKAKIDQLKLQLQQSTEQYNQFKQQPNEPQTIELNKQLQLSETQRNIAKLYLIKLQGLLAQQLEKIESPNDDQLESSSLALLKDKESHMRQIEQQVETNVEQKILLAIQEIQVQLETFKKDIKHLQNGQETKDVNDCQHVEFVQTLQQDLGYRQELLQQLTNQCEHHQKDFNSLAMYVEVSEEDYKQSEKQRQFAEKELVDVLLENQQLKHDMRLQQLSNEARAVRDMKEELHMEAQQKQKYQILLSDLQEELDRLKFEKWELKVEKETLVVKCAELKEQLQLTRQQLEESKQQIELNQKQLAELNSKMQALQISNALLTNDKQMLIELVKRKDELFNEQEAIVRNIKESMEMYKEQQKLQRVKTATATTQTTCPIHLSVATNGADLEELNLVAMPLQQMKLLMKLHKCEQQQQFKELNQSLSDELHRKPFDQDQERMQQMDEQTKLARQQAEKRAALEHKLTAMKTGLELTSNKLRKSQVKKQYVEAKNNELYLEIGALNLDAARAALRETELRQSLDTANKKSTELESIIEYQNTKINSLHVGIAQLLRESQSRQNQETEMIAKPFEQLQVQFKEQQSIMVALSTQLEALRNDHKNVQDENEKLQHYVNKAKALEAKFCDSLNKINKRFDNQDNVNSSLDIKINALFECFQNKFQEAQSEFVRIISNIKDRNEVQQSTAFKFQLINAWKISNIENELSSAFKDCEHFRNGLKECQNLVHDLKAQIQNWMQFIKISLATEGGMRSQFNCEIATGNRKIQVATLSTSSMPQLIDRIAQTDLSVFNPNRKL